jgi:hypothetical protein
MCLSTPPSSLRIQQECRRVLTPGCTYRAAVERDEQVVVAVRGPAALPSGRQQP